MLRMVLFVTFLASSASAQTLGPVVTGDARMGIVWNPPPAWAGQRETGLRMTSRARLNFQFTGETDGGLRYGVEFNLDQSDKPRRQPRVFLGGSH